jgi:CspA family cold shock protein
MPTGTVKSYEPGTGYGFIIPDGGGPDVFVHGRAIDRAGLGTLWPGQRITYMLVQRKAGKGQSAEHLQDASAPKEGSHGQEL